jgi:cell wall-associated NlpC family hydrolase
MIEKRKALIEETRKYVGQPFRHQGRGERGFDCAGLMMVVVDEVLDIAPPYDRSDYGRRPPPRLVFEGMAKVAVRIPPNEAQGGDLAQLSYNNLPTHLGLLTFDNTIIHATIAARKVIEQRFDEDLRRRIVAYWRLSVFE